MDVKRRASEEVGGPSEVREKTNKMPQLDVYYQYFLNMFRASNSNLHSARTVQRSAPQPLPTTSSRTSAAHHVQ